MTLEFMKTQIQKFNSMVFAIHAKEGIKQPLIKTLTRLKTFQLTKRKQRPNVMMATKKGTKTELRTSDVPRCHMCKEMPT
jgi:hypothetical protein